MIHTQHIEAERLRLERVLHDATQAAEALLIALRAHATPQAVAKAPTWTLRKPQRFHGYTEPLYEALRAAHAGGQPCPTAREILRAWVAKLPWEVIEATPEGIKYETDASLVKFAGVGALSKAIKRMAR